VNALFYTSALVAVWSTALVITRLNAVHALLYLIVSLLAVAMMFSLLGAPFAAALQVIIYAGAIMVLFIFVMMLLNLGPQSIRKEGEWLNPASWIGPAILAFILVAELIYALAGKAASPIGAQAVEPVQVGIALFGQYLLGVELASMLLLAGLVGAFHLGQRETTSKSEPTQARSTRPETVQETPCHAENVPTTKETQQARVR
jgi:NADH-quinone oxidoreductase subunit J